MTDYFEFETFRRGYISLCMYNSVVSCFSVGIAVWTVLFVYFPGAVALNNERMAVWLSGSGVLLVLLCNFMIATGHALWLRVSVGLLVLCLVIVIPSKGGGVGLLTYSISIVLPLLGLISFNSRLHRRFYSGFREFRMLRAQASVGSVVGGKFGYGTNSTRVGGRGISRREIAESNRRRDLEEKVAARKRQTRNKVTYPIGASLVLFFIGAMGYLIYDGFASGYILLGGRGQPYTRYTLSEQPGGFWFGITMYTICIMLSIAGLWLMHLMYKMEARK